MQATLRLARPNDDELGGVAAGIPGLSVERVGEATAMTRASSEAARGSAPLTATIVLWAVRNGFVAFDSSGGFTLANDVLRSDPYGGTVGSRGTAPRRFPADPTSLLA